MKTFLKAGLLLALISIFTISCSNEESLSNDNTSLRNESLQRKIKIKFMIGLSANLEKPSEDCKSGWGVCSVTIAIVNIGVERKINMGVSDDNYLHFEIDATDIEGSTMEIKDGDQQITFGEEVINYFEKEDLDISSIALVKGKYGVNYDSSSDKYLIKIPFTRL